VREWGGKGQVHLAFAYPNGDQPSDYPSIHFGDQLDPKDAAALLRSPFKKEPAL